MTRSLLPGLIAAALIALPAFAQTEAPVPSPAAPAPANADEAFSQAMQKMHGAMMTEPTGDADVDFARGMIPHHQGAIDMARIQLEFGDDPELRRMAEEIISAQEAEIARLQDWLQRNAPDAASAGASAGAAAGAPPEPKPASEAPQPRPVHSAAPEAKPAN